MVIAKLIGGLGNQMFQYAFGYCLAKRNNSIFKLDTSKFSDYKLHKFSLDHLNINSNFATVSEIKKMQNYSNSPIAKLRNLFSLSSNHLNSHHITEKSFNFDKEISNLKGNYYLDGYWQTEKYFLDYQDLIRNEFKVKSDPDDINKKFINQITNSNSVSIHIRHGDYLINSKTKTVHGVLPLSYYNQAIAIIKNKVTNPVFFVFSDDIEWAKQNLNKDVPIFFMDHNNADKNYEDLRLMSLCKYNIIANSSFSWWGAWLNDNPNKIVIVPQQWFGDSSKNINDLIPKNWLKINNE